MNRFMHWLRRRDAINIGGAMGFHTAWTQSGPWRARDLSLVADIC